MRLIIFLLHFFFLNVYSYAQTSLVEVYKTHAFSCDKGSTTLETNLCSGEKVEFADSLLNKVYNQILRSIDKEIAYDRSGLSKENAKTDTSKIDREMVAFLYKDIDRYKNLKESIINSQRQWIKVRDQNAKVVRLNCEGGTACNAITNYSVINDILERIKKLESFYGVE